MQRKVDETDVVMGEVERVSQQYLPLSSACSSIYFTLESLHQVLGRVLVHGVTAPDTGQGVSAWSHCGQGVVHGSLHQVLGRVLVHGSLHQVLGRVLVHGVTAPDTGQGVSAWSHPDTFLCSVYNQVGCNLAVLSIIHVPVFSLIWYGMIPVARSSYEVCPVK